MYSLISVDNEEVTKAKGVNKKLRHKEFVSVLFNKKVIRHNIKIIQSKLQWNLALVQKFPNTGLFLVRIWTIFMQWGLMMFVRFHYHDLMIKDTY